MAPQIPWTGQFISMRPFCISFARCWNLVARALPLIALLLWVERASGQATTTLLPDAKCLLDFKSFVGDPHNTLSNWNENNAADVCKWAGVQCFGNLAPPVFKLLLSNYELASSTWPTVLKECTSLQTIDFSWNSFTGPLPANICGDFPNLVTFRLGHNKFDGPIPPNLGTCRFLNDLYLNDNVFTGPVPAELVQAPRLVDLDLSNNDLSGTIPAEFSAAIPGTNIPKFNASSFEENPYLCGAPLTTPCRTRKKPGVKTGVIVGGIFGGVVALLALMGLGFWCFVRRSRSKEKLEYAKKRRKLQGPKMKLLYPKDSKWVKKIVDPNGVKVSMFENPVVSRIAFTELLEGTGGFSAEKVIATNQTGTVYKATLKSGQEVAIKRLRVSESMDNEKAFRTEMEALGDLKHHNLVPLLGYCVAAGERLLVYEHMPHGSLWERLHDPEQKQLHGPLLWGDRVRMATGIARGLAYLHHSCNPRVLHRNVNPRAILLDAHDEPRITDFGLARLSNPNDTHVSTFFNGDYGEVGYVSPETIRTFVASTKGDVYSFGVVVLELVTSQRATNVMTKDGSRYDENLVQYVMSLENVADAVDPALIGNDKDKDSTEEGEVDEEMVQMLKVAMSCVAAEPKERPNMFEVHQLLQAIGKKYAYSSSFNELPSLHEDEEEVHIDTHEETRVEIHML